MTLRHSRHSFRPVVWKSSQQAWAELHERAWRYFVGSTQYVVLDNLKEGVLKPDLYEPKLNPVYAAMLAHYGVVGFDRQCHVTFTPPAGNIAVDAAVRHLCRCRPATSAVVRPRESPLPPRATK
jgi:hypothetical protein